MAFELVYLFILSAVVRTVKTVQNITQIGGHKFITAVFIVIDTVFFLVVFREVVIGDFTLPVLGAVASGYVVGYYIGTYIEEKMALGKLIVTIKISKKHSKKLSKKLRENGFVFIRSKRFYSHKGKLKKLHQGVIFRDELPKLKAVTKDFPVIATVEEVKSVFGEKVVSSKEYLQIQKESKKEF
jgi:uncharacterized protein YebE (UPF0316 family)